MVKKVTSELRLCSEAEPLISIVVTCCDQREQALACLRVLQAQQTRYERSEIILVDHCSADNVRIAVMSSFPGVRVVSAPKSLSRSKAGALGAMIANGVVTVVIDCAAEIDPNLIQRLANFYLTSAAPASQQVIMSLPAQPETRMQQVVA